MRMLATLTLCAAAWPVWAAHGYALWGNLQYPPNFPHFSYVNPQAPKGGELRLVSNFRTSTFDKYNPFTMRGSAPAYLGAMLFDSLLAGSSDETAAAYGLLAQDVEVSADGLSVTFRLRREARFHDDSPVLAADVKHSYDTLIGPHTTPAYKTLLEDVAGLDVLDDRTLRYRFKKANRELPLTVGGLPVFSRKWGDEIDKATGGRKSFDKVVMDIPIGSGPYKIGPVKFGKDITYVRDEKYWARDLNVRKGSANFDRITVKIYKDSTARLEGLKAGEFDALQINVSREWARQLYGKKFDSGELVKKEFKHKLPAGFQSYFLNTRNPKLRDIRVRQALGLAIDFEWMNRQFFYNAYSRGNGLFGNTDCEATGMPGPAELALMEPWRKDVPLAAFGPMTIPPRTDGDQSLRGNLTKAVALLKEAGWEYKEGALRNAKGEAFVLEYADSSEGSQRVVTPWVRALDKLGIQLHLKVSDYAVYQERLKKFDFEVISLNIPGTHSPGQDYAELFGSKAATTEDSSNFAGVVNPAVDAMIEKMVGARSLAQLVPACKALDRIISHSHYLLPQWTSPSHRLVYNDRLLAQPATMPPYTSSGVAWIIDTWWARPAR